MSPWFIAYLLLACIALLLNIHVVYLCIKHQLLNNPTNRLIFYLHISSFILNIVTWPTLYQGNHSVCEMMSFFHYYGGLANVGVLCFLTYSYRNFVFSIASSYQDLIDKYSGYVIFLFPCIVFLPFSTDAYDTQRQPWCTLDIYDFETQLWAFGTFYVWAISALVVCFAVFISIFRHAFEHDPETGKRMFFSLGVYVIVTWFALLPRCINRVILLFTTILFDYPEQFLTLGPIPIAGIIYSLTFYKNLPDYLRYAVHFTSRAESSNQVGVSLDELGNLSSVRGTNDSLQSDSTTVLASVTNNPIQNHSRPQD